MGFGKKTDFSTGKTLDLDKTYKNIIQPAVESSGFQCVRADEIQDSGLIDKSMYALLMHAELVVADISTYNPNAIYELGIRHAVRPFSTIILKEEDGKIPFDLDHTRMFSYRHLGEDIGADEAQRCREALTVKIAEVTRKSLVDSPLYGFIQDITPPELSKAEYQRIIGDLADREAHIFATIEKAKQCMIDDEFEGAAALWEKARKSVPSETYFVQQHALAVYKSNKPTEFTALIDALKIIEHLDIEGDTNDPETLGITGAIYKRMWLLSQDVESLKRAIHYYERGFQIRDDYYTGENYALCLNMMANISEDPEEKIYHNVGAKKARQSIVEQLKKCLPENIDETISTQKWELATLANCYFGLGDKDIAGIYERRFYDLTDVKWERKTYEDNKKSLLSLIEASKSP
jgi:tetratricopeptide (TPR) repeat protein